MVDLVDSFLSDARVSLSKYVDNELNSDFYPSPNTQPTGDGIKVQTANNETGVNKDAGTGSQFVVGVPNGVLFGVGGLTLAAIIYFAVK